MPQSLVYNYIHIVFSTKYRYPFIDREIEEELFSYIGSICKNMGFSPLQVGGYRDHIHILCRMSKDVTLVKFLQQVKSKSSIWMKTKGMKYQHFYWQRGYGCFSVNPKDIDVVIRYIERQALHHAKRSFQEEYLIILNKYKIPYDLKYLWD
ncbi:MAG: IS200/IS605 family transposase [Spirosomataceae bacterium]